MVDTPDKKNSGCLKTEIGELGDFFSKLNRYEDLLTLGLITQRRQAAKKIVNDL